jgi:hypothetical protein
VGFGDAVHVIVCTMWVSKHTGKNERAVTKMGYLLPAWFADAKKEKRLVGVLIVMPLKQKCYGADGPATAQAQPG